MDNLGQLAQRVFNSPVAIHPSKAEVIVAALAHKYGLGNIQINRVSLNSEPDGDDFLSGRAEVDRGYDVIGPVAVIPIIGTLVQKSGYLRPTSGLTGYNSVRLSLLNALDDKSVRGIVFDVDSPGGEVAGCFDLADRIYAARGQKPIWSILSEHAYSAAYALASAADRVIVPRTGGTGSIGVICMHVDMSKWLSKEGVAVTLIQYGDRKADGAQTEPLTDAARARAQADIDTMGALFDNLVARNRKLTADRVKSFQAGTFMGEKGIAAGLADAVMAPDAAMRAFLKTL